MGSSNSMPCRAFPLLGCETYVAFQTTIIIPVFSTSIYLSLTLSLILHLAGVSALMDSQRFAVCVLHTVMDWRSHMVSNTLSEGDVMRSTVGRQWIRFGRVLRTSGDQRDNQAMWSHIT